MFDSQLFLCQLRPAQHRPGGVDDVHTPWIKMLGQCRARWSGYIGKRYPAGRAFKLSINMFGGQRQYLCTYAQ